MGFFKYLLDGGKENYFIKKYISQDQEIIDFVVNKNYTLSVVELYQLRDIVLRKSVSSENITQQEAISKCGNIETHFGFYWIKSIVEKSLNIELIIVNNPFNKISNVK